MIKITTIHKYPLEIKDEQIITIPFIYTGLYTALNIKKQILKLDVQNEIPCLWTMVDDKAYKRDIKVTIYRTGYECPELIENYIDSFQICSHDIQDFYHVFVKEK